MLVGILTFMFGVLAHGSTTGTVCELVGMLMLALSSYLTVVEFECKGVEDMELINLYKMWCKEKGLRPTEATNLRRFLNLIQK